MASDPKPGDTGATAIVTITVEVESGSSWGKDTTLEQVYDQAKEGALARLRAVIKSAPNIRVIGEPTVKQILTRRVR